MKVTNADGKAFTLRAEDEADRELLSALHLVRHVDLVESIPLSVEGGGWIVDGYHVFVDDTSPGKLVRDAAGEALGCLGKLFRIGLREAAQHGHVGAFAADPQLQVALPALLEQLQAVVQALGNGIGKPEIVVQEIRGAHGDLSAKGPSIAQAGSAS